LKQDPTNTREVNKAKLKGQFKIEVNDHLKLRQKVQAAANDYLAFYMHKNDHFLKLIDKIKSVKDLKNINADEETKNIIKKYKNIDKELELYRK